MFQCFMRFLRDFFSVDCVLVAGSNVDCMFATGSNDDCVSETDSSVV